MSQNNIYYIKKIGLKCCSICSKWKSKEEMSNYNDICKDCYKTHKKQIKGGIL